MGREAPEVQVLSMDRLPTLWVNTHVISAFQAVSLSAKGSQLPMTLAKVGLRDTHKVTGEQKGEPFTRVPQSWRARVT